MSEKKPFSLQDTKDPVFEFLDMEGKPREVDPFEVEKKIQAAEKGADTFDIMRSAFGFPTEAENKDLLDKGGIPTALISPYKILSLYEALQEFTQGLEVSKKSFARMAKLRELSPFNLPNG